MAISLNLTNLANLQNETTAVNAINANNSAIITAFLDALALDGTTPNMMLSDLDMNSNDILNLPTPTSQYSPVRLVDLDQLSAGGTISVQPLPSGGLTGQALVKNSDTNFDTVWSNTMSDLVVTGSFSAPGIVSASLLASLPITLGTTAMTLGNTYSAISGALTFSGALTMSSAVSLTSTLNYGGVTLNNAVTGTGNMVLSASPTLTGTLSFGTLSPTSFANSITTITGLTINSSPVAASDYLCYFSSANGAINRISVANLISSTTAGVTSIGGSTGVVTLGGSLTISGNVLTDNWTTGDVKTTFKTTADSGWLLMADQTIGDASSGADFASATASALFTLLWTNVGSAWAPVSGGYGVSAAADFAAHKKMTLPKALGRAIAAAGTGSGLLTYTLGQNTGTNTHALTTAELAVHSHGISDPGHTHPITTGQIGAGTADVIYQASQNNVVVNTTSNQTGITVLNEGSGTAHTIMQPTLFVNYMVKL